MRGHDAQVDDNEDDDDDDDEHGYGDDGVKNNADAVDDGVEDGIYAEDAGGGRGEDSGNEVLTGINH